MCGAELADGARLAGPPQRRSVGPPGEDAVLAGLEGGGEDVLDVEGARGGLELEAGRRGGEHERVAHPVVGLDDRPHLREDPAVDVVGEELVAELEQLGLRPPAPGGQRQLEQLVEILRRPDARPRDQQRLGELDRPDVPAADAVRVEGLGREAVDQGAVVVEARHDVRPSVGGVNAPEEAREVHDSRRYAMMPAVSSQVFRDGVLNGQVAIVTGGGSGLGRATALELAALGATVVGCGRRQEPLARRPRWPRAEACACDIREEDQVDALVDGVLERHGSIDMLVNNAGGQYLAPAEDITPKGFRTVMRLNVEGTWLMTHAVATKAMIPAGRGGKIVNVTLSPHHGLPGMAHSSAARAAVENMTRVLSIEWARFGIRADGDRPRPLRDRRDPEVPRAGRARRGGPCRSAARAAEEQAWLVAYLASPAGDYFSGAVFTLDGARDNWFGAWPPADITDEPASRSWRSADPLHDPGVDAGGVLELHEVADALDALELAPGRDGLRERLGDRRLHAAVLGAVEDQRGRLGLDGERRLQALLEVVAVVAQGGAAAARSAQRLEDVDEILAGVVAGGPVAPELRDHLVEAALGGGQLVVEEVPAHPRLAGGHAELERRERLDDRGGRRNGERDVLAEAVRFHGGDGIGRDRAPVVADQDGPIVAPQGGGARARPGPGR